MRKTSAAMPVSAARVSYDGSLRCYDLDELNSNLNQQNKIVMKEKRASNKLKQKQLETKYLEEQTKKMQDKLSELKRQIQDQKKMRTELNLESTVTRWQKATRTATGPLKSYAKQVLEEQKQAYAQFGINQKKVTGTKTFEGVLQQIKQQKEIQQDRNPTKITTFLKQPEKQQQTIHQGVLQNNFFKAKMDVKKLIKQKTLQDFLEENYILEYLPQLRQAGITDLQGLRYVNKERLAWLGVKAGHQAKIIKKIKEQFDKLLNGKYEEKPQETVTQKVQSGYGQGDVNVDTNPQLIQKEEQVQKLQLQSKIQKEEQQQQNYEDQEQDVVLITVPMHEVSLQIGDQPQSNCYECYKVVTSSQWRYDEKYFCSQNCMEKYLSQLRKNCPSCGKIFIKTQGYRQQGLWFCCLGCCPNQQQIQDMFFQWHAQGK